MKRYIDAFSNYLSENPMEPVGCQMNKLLDRLYCCYTQQKGMNKGHIQQSFCQLDSILSQLPIQQQDAVVDTTCNLCTAYQKEGFQDGILVGFRLFTELS